MKVFFEERNIMLHELDGYQEVIEVKKVNNNIKHSDQLSEEIGRIQEFCSGMEFQDLERFFNRVKPKIATFQNKLSEAVVDELFKFNENKLDALVDEIRERMTKDDAKKYIKKLKNKFGL
jgi:hypothetical protein